MIKNKLLRQTDKKMIAQGPQAEIRKLQSKRVNIIKINSPHNKRMGLMFMKYQIQFKFFKSLMKNGQKMFSKHRNGVKKLDCYNN